MYDLILPVPPSVNSLWRSRVAGKRAITYVTAKGKEYRSTVADLVVEQLGDDFEDLEGDLRVCVVLLPPDRRKRDIDNVAKALLDSLEHAGVYANDSQINRLELTKCDRDDIAEAYPAGAVLVRIHENHARYGEEDIND